MGPTPERPIVSTRWAARSWLGLFFGELTGCNKLTERFHSIIDADAGLATEQFVAFVRRERSCLGDLHLDARGALVCAVYAGPTYSLGDTCQTRGFKIEMRTLEALNAVHLDCEAQRDNQDQSRLGRTNPPPGTGELDTLVPFASSLPLETPKRIGKYEVIRLIGRGGMGAVYLANDPILDRPIAIKVLPGAQFNDREAVARLMREAKLGASLHHPAICRVLDAAQEDGDFFFAMEFVEGKDLYQLIRERGPFPVGVACDFAHQLFGALAAMAEAGVVHRDVKPSNIMLRPDGRIKLLDLGIAKDVNNADSMVVTGQNFMGTPAYAAPEQFLNKVDARVDVYAAGLTLYQMLTARLPHPDSANLLEIWQWQASDARAANPREFRPDLPEPLAGLVLRLVAKNPDDRPGHAEVLESLAAFRGPRESSAQFAQAVGPVDDQPSGTPATACFPATPPVGAPETGGRTPALPIQVPVTRPSLPLPPKSDSPPAILHALQSVWHALPRLLGRLFVGASTSKPNQAERTSEIPQVGKGLPRPPSISEAPAAIQQKVLANLEVARREIEDSDAADIAAWLPTENGLPRIGNYLLKKRLGVAAAAVHTYIARHLEADFGCIVRLLPLALGQLAPEKIHQLRSKRGELMRVSQQCPHLTRLLSVEKTELDRGHFKNLYYTVEDLANGQSLEELCSRGRTLTVEEAETYLRQSLEGLSALHEARLLHGNLHPAKIVVDARRTHAQICDLSHACEFPPRDADAVNPRLTRAVHAVDILGDRSAKRRRYLAPEVLYECDALRGAPSEQFALGVIFLEALNGQFTASQGGVDKNDYQRQVDIQDFLERVKTQSPRLEQVLRRMVHVSPARRYPSLGAACAELANAATAPETGAPVVPAIPEPAPMPPPPGPIPPTPQTVGPVNRSLSTMPVPGSGYLQVRGADRKALTRLLAEQANAYPSGPSVFFEKLVGNVNLPLGWAADLEPSFRQKPGVAADLLVDWATQKKEHPREPRLTVLGSILRALLPKLGFSDARFVVALITHYRLYQAADLEGLEMRYLVPKPAEQFESGQQHGLETINHGPDITWKGPAEETLELQRWLPATSALLDVGFLHRAMEQTAAICRLEFEGSERRGTGFLVGKHHVLTCYHVLKSHDGEDMEANGRRARLRFGCFANPTGDESTGQVFKLAERPIVRASPPDRLDYVLLRVDDSIADASELRRVTWSLEAPQIEQALNILQHPDGDVMKIALCSSGVANLDNASGRLQYATAAKPGSSGAPCFNDAWEVIAIHHAQRARALFSIREGILFNRIFPEIRDQL